MSVKHAQEFLRLAMKDEKLRELLPLFSFDELKTAAGALKTCISTSRKTHTVQGYYAQSSTD